MLGYDWWLCMVINTSVQCNGGPLPDITPMLSPSRYPLNTMNLIPPKCFLCPEDLGVF